MKPLQLTLKPGKVGVLTTLGISQSRATKLRNHSQKSFEKSKGKLTDFLHEISKECKTPNELALSCFIAGEALGGYQMQGQVVRVMVRKKK